MTDGIDAARILIVDDEYANVRLLERILVRAGFHQVIGTSDSRRVPDLCRTFPPDLLLLDLRMPGLDGFEVLDILVRERPAGDFLPVIILTADESREARERALSGGATDFLAKPFQPFEILLRIRNHLHTRFLYLQLEERNRSLERRVMDRTLELEKAQREILERLTQAVEARDGETGDHTRRVGVNAARLAASVGLPETRVEVIRRAAPLHDVGKIAVPDTILLKPGRLTDEERRVLESHTTSGARLLSRGESDLLRTAELIALSRHERWDGRGYPNGFETDAIPFEARIVAIIDVFDALSHDRPYRAAWPADRVKGFMREQVGSHFDPEIAAVFFDLHGAGELLV